MKYLKLFEQITSIKKNDPNLYTFLENEFPSDYSIGFVEANPKNIIEINATDDGTTIIDLWEEDFYYNMVRAETLISGDWEGSEEWKKTMLDLLEKYKTTQEYIEWEINQQAKKYNL